VSGTGWPLTERQAEILRLIESVYEAMGEAPSVLYLARRLHLHHSTVQDHLRVMCDRGWLRVPRPEGLIVEKIVMGNEKPAAGPPSLQVQIVSVAKALNRSVDQTQGALNQIAEAHNALDARVEQLAKAVGMLVELSREMARELRAGARSGKAAPRRRALPAGSSIIERGRDGRMTAIRRIS